MKEEVRAPRAKAFAFMNMKTMYGGKHMAKGDTVFIFASETQGGQGLVARGVVTKAEPVPPKPGGARQTPRVNIWVKSTALAKRALGRAELKAWRGIDDGSSQAELDFKLYRQATNKIVGIEAPTVKLLQTRFGRSSKTPRANESPKIAAKGLAATPKMRRS